MTIQAQAADGSIHQFPDGTNPSVIDRVMKAYATSKSPQQSAPSQPLDPALRSQAEDFLKNPDLPAQSTTPQEAAARAQSGPADDQQRARDLRSGSHDAPAYQKQGQSLPGWRQTLYDMATNDVERFKILSRYYGKDNVGRDQYGLYIKSKDGRQVYPRSNLGSGLAANAAPVIGGAAGALAGSAAGGPAGAVGGSAGGAVVGQGVNDAVLGIMGFYDRTMGSEAANLATQGLESGALEGAGKLVGAGAKAAGTSAKDLATKPLRSALGYDPEKASVARDLVSKGYSINPASYAPDAKRIARVVESSRLYGADYTAKSEEKFARDQAIATMKKQGMTDEQAAAEYERMKTPSAVSSQPAGQALKTAAADEAESGRGATDRARSSILSEAEQQGKNAIAQRDATVRQLKTRYSDLQSRLQTSLDQGKRTLDQLATQVKKGPLAEDYAKRIIEYRNGIQRDATELYNYADEIAGDSRVNAEPAREAATQFMQNLPKDLREQFPVLVKRIAGMAGGEEGGSEMTFGEAHYLRSQLRDLAYSDKLSPEFKKGAYKHLSSQVDKILHDSEASPSLKEAAKTLDFADEFYAKNMRQFNNATMENLVKQIKDGLPPDPVKIARMVAQNGEMATLDRVLRIGGEPLRKRVAAADLQDVLAQSRKLGSQNIDPKELLNALTERQNNRTLTRLYGSQGNALMLYATRLAAKGGSIPISSFNPVGIMERDGFMRALEAANRIQDKITELTKKKPMEIMEAFLKPAKERIAQLEKAFGGRLSADMMKFLRDPELLAEKAASRVLDSEELLEEAARRFPQAMPVLQKYALQRVLAPLSRGQGSGTLLTTLGRLTPKQQAILFPAGMAQDLKKLADGLSVIRGPATHSMPGFSAGSVLGAEPVGLEGLTPAGKRQFITEGIAKLVTSPMFNRAVLAALAKDVASGPAGVTRAMTKIQALLSLAPRSVIRGAQPAKTQGTPEGQAQLPQQEKANLTQSWRKYLQ